METPLARFARWIAHRNDVPAERSRCDMCGTDLAPAEGTWDLGWTERVCTSPTCITEAAEQRSW